MQATSYPWPPAHQQEGDLLAELLSLARERSARSIEALEAKLLAYEEELIGRIRDLTGRAFPDLELPEGAGIQITHSEGDKKACLVVHVEPKPPAPKPTAKPAKKPTAKPQRKKRAKRRTKK